MVGLALATSIPLVWELLTPPRDAGTLPVADVVASQRPATAADALARTGAARADADTRRPGDGRGAAGSGDVRAAEDSGAAPDGAAGDGDSSAAAAGDDGTGDDGAASDPRPVARSARIADLDQAPTAAPTRLRIPSIGVAAPAVAVGVEDDGEMEVPADVRDVGWYRHGPAPGEPGAAVIAGHVDSREQGRGAFFDLRRLDVGARVEVTDADGNVQRFDVVARRTYDKAVLPADALFARDGPPQLVLITCGGDFDPAAGSYRENVVVYAQPSGG